MVATTMGLFERSGELDVSGESNMNAEPAALWVKRRLKEENGKIRPESRVVDSLATHGCVTPCE